jgi:hypothetical protein
MSKKNTRGVIELLAIRRSAKKLGLRDKGEMDLYVEDSQWVMTTHNFCHTRVRIGIRMDGTSVKYCWKCELELATSESKKPPHDEPPGGRKTTVLGETTTTQNAGDVVVPIDRGKKKDD